MILSGSKAQSFPDVFGLKIWKVDQQITYGAARSNSFYDHSNCDSHPTDARLTAHHRRIHGDSPKFLHRLIIANLPNGTLLLMASSLDPVRLRADS